MLNAVLGVASLLGGIGNEQRANRASRDARAAYDDSKQVAGDSYRMLVDAYNQRKASDAYNADEALQLARDDAARTAKVGGSNIAAQLGGLGYKKGDSKPNQETRYS